MVAPPRDYRCECPLVLKVYLAAFILAVAGSIAFVLIHNVGPDADQAHGTPALEARGKEDPSTIAPPTTSAPSAIGSAVYVVCHCDEYRIGTEVRHPHRLLDLQPESVVVGRCKCGILEMRVGPQYQIKVGDRRLMLVDVSISGE